jgi:hypothetical protein
LRGENARGAHIRIGVRLAPRATEAGLVDSERKEATTQLRQRIDAHKSRRFRHALHISLFPVKLQPG